MESIATQYPCRGWWFFPLYPVVLKGLLALSILWMARNDRG